MKTITSNEEYVRLRIYEKDLPPNKAYQELLRIEQEQRKSDNFFNNQRIERLLAQIEDLESRCHPVGPAEGNSTPK